MAVESALKPDIRAEQQVRRVDAAIAELARRQHGVVARRQLTDFGLSRRAIGHRLESGRLHSVHRGVFAVGHSALPGEGRWLAAVLAGGPAAVLSHRSAAALWGMRPTAGRRTDVTAPRWRRPRDGIRFHQGRPLHDEVTVVRQIPATTVPRTLLDLAAVFDERQLARAMNEAELLRLRDRLSLDDLIARHPHRRGVRLLKAVLDAGRLGTAVTRSELERRFLGFVREAGLPAPRVNALLEVAGQRMEVDCLWHGSALVVELDGHATHATRAAFERDRARDRALQAAGWRVVRITWRQLREAPATLARDLRELLR